MANHSGSNPLLCEDRTGAAPRAAFTHLGIIHRRAKHRVLRNNLHAGMAHSFV